MGTRGELGVLGGGEKHNIKRIIKKPAKKSQKSAKLEKNWKNLIFLLKMFKNALGTPRNTFKSQQSVKKPIKSAKLGKNRKNRIFLLKMVSNALGTPRNSFKSQKSAKKNIKSGKIWLGYVRLGYLFRIFILDHFQYKKKSDFSDFFPISLLFQIFFTDFFWRFA